MLTYYFQRGEAQQPKFILLHGTGGDEHSLDELAEYLAPKATILSFRGAVEEQGHLRFFKRDGLNQFDYVSLEQETDHLFDSIRMVSEEERIPLTEWILVGYSNGANIAAHLLLQREVSLQRAILFHPMSLGLHTEHFSLTDKTIWLSYGINDPIVSEASMLTLATAFKERGATVGVHPTESGHQVTLEEVESASSWLKQKD
ncbi:MAG: alpha/beta hydrolase [Enterococcus sp.]